MYPARNLTLSRCFAILAFLATTAALSLPARAVPVDVFFDGNAMGGATNFGVSEAQALNLQSSFGVPIVQSFDYIGSASGLLAVTQSLQSFTPSPPTSTTNRATSAWTAQNVSGMDLLGASYLIFTSSTPFVKNGVTVDYIDSNIGITIDSALGWVLVKAPAGNDDFYYPALLLDRSASGPLAGVFLNGQIESLVIDYVVKQALIDTPIGSGDYELPLLNIGLAYAAVPEPGTAVLVSLGLVGIAIRRRHS